MAKLCEAFEDPAFRLRSCAPLSGGGGAGVEGFDTQELLKQSRFVAHRAITLLPSNAEVSCRPGRTYGDSLCVAGHRDKWRMAICLHGDAERHAYA